MVLTPVCVRFAPGVAIKPHPSGARILSALDRLAIQLQQDVHVTSGAENQGRLPTDPHCLGEAFDVRTRDLTPVQIIGAYDFLRTFFGVEPFTVLFEGPTAHPDARLAAVQYVNPKATGFHFHIQRAKNQVFP